MNDSHHILNFLKLQMVLHASREKTENGQSDFFVYTKRHER